MSALESACCELQHNKTRQQHLLVSFVQPVWCCKGIFVGKPTHSFVACPTENKHMEWSVALANRTLDEAAAAAFFTVARFDLLLWCDRILGIDSAYDSRFRSRPETSASE